jgi:hypothetical protein
MIRATAQKCKECAGFFVKTMKDIAETSNLLEK